VSDPEVEFTLTPRQIGNYAQFMYDDGLIRNRPASWKDLFFDNIHALPGS
jgi:NitT/TauT family transport system substrate-binding protein